jgi:hemolysin activation/secretion protein
MTSRDFFPFLLHWKKGLNWTCLLLASTHLYAQTVRPDAGEVLRGSGMKPPVPPSPTKPGLIPAPESGGAATAPGGASVMVKEVLLKGNTVFTASQIRAIIQDLLGKELDLAGMKDLARRISDHYHAQGYPFARAVVPVQDFQDGLLSITILEGYYEDVTASGEPDVVGGVTPFLSRLRSGEILESGRLERSMLIIDDLPGVGVTPSVGPGSKVGTSDLDVAARMDSMQSGSIGIDNAGSRYTGYHRFYASWNRNRLLTFGDKLSAMAMVTDLSMVLGSAEYEAPIGGDGLRWHVSHARTTYELGREYTDLGASGLAKVWSAKLAYPLVRSQKTNLNLSAGLQHKDLQDDFRAAATREEKSTLSFPVTLRFDRRDGFNGGGVSYGMLGWTPGQLTLDDALLATDAVTARKSGAYHKFNFDLARIQNLGQSLMLYGRFSGQWASNNLDSSERLGVGGAEAVRAYPLGEGTGDVGWLGQLELRYDTGTFAPYLLYDYGEVRINYRPWDALSDQRRRISGAGFGLRYDHQEWSGNVAVSFPLKGGAPTQDVGNPDCRVYFSLNRSF